MPKCTYFKMGGISSENSMEGFRYKVRGNIGVSRKEGEVYGKN